MISEDLYGKATISRKHRIWQKIKIRRTTTPVLLHRTVSASDVPSIALTLPRVSSHDLTSLMRDPPSTHYVCRPLDRGLYKHLLI